MFETAPVLWMQSWSSPSITLLMNAVSIAGSFPSCLAVAAFYAFGVRMRSGVALLLIVVLGAVLTDIAKVAFHTPRPYQVDARVRVLGSFVPGSEDSAGTDRSESTFGFPSGHVEAITALVFAMWWLRRRRIVAVVGAGWIVLTAASRLYLGRHYVGDVVGGCAIGLVCVFLAWAMWRLGALIRHETSRWIPLSLLITGASMVLLVLATARVSAIETGRLCGIATAAALLVQWNRLGDPDGVARRAVRVLIALGVVAVGVIWSARGAQAEIAPRVSAFAITTLLNAAVLLIPVSVPAQPPVRTLP